MAATTMARHRGAGHAERTVLALVHRVLQRRPETRPAGAALEFGLGREQRQVATGAAESAVAMLVEQRAGERPLGAFPAEHVKLFRRQQLAPLIVTMGHFVNAALGAGNMRPRQAKYPERGDGRPGVKQMSASEHSSLSPVTVSRAIISRNSLRASFRRGALVLGALRAKRSIVARFIDKRRTRIAFDDDSVQDQT